MVLPRRPYTAASSRDEVASTVSGILSGILALPPRPVLPMEVGDHSESGAARSGEPGQNKLNGPLDEKAAIKDFEKKFKDKTKVRRRL